LKEEPAINERLLCSESLVFYNCKKVIVRILRFLFRKLKLFE